MLFGEEIHADNKHMINALLRRVDTKPVTCQYCHKIGHTADRCRLTSDNQTICQHFFTNTNSGQTNFLINQNYNNARISQPALRSKIQNTRNTQQVTCRYCKKTGHEIDNCRKLSQIS